MMSREEHKLLKARIKLILSGYQHWIWNDLSKILSIVWKYEIESMMEMDPKLLTAEGFLNGLWREKVTPAEDIYEVFKELQLVNNNHKSQTLNMENVQPQRVGILAHLKSGKTLTHLEAVKLFSCSRLASVVNRLLKHNTSLNIVCNIAEVHRYGVYSIHQEDKVIS